MKIFIPLAMWVGSAKIPKAFGMRVEAFFCHDFLFLFHLRKKKAERLFED
jgi:hypothetical protein